MKHSYGDLPLFVYGTLRNDRKYCKDVQRYNPRIETAYCYGNLYYNDFVDENGCPCVTVALEPTGAQRVKGQLFHFNSHNYHAMLAEFDDKEFNFADLTSKGKTSIHSRVYIRSVINCINVNGEIMQAYAYILFSKTFPINCLPPVNDDLSFDSHVEFPEAPIEHNKFAELLDARLKKYKHK